MFSPKYAITPTLLANIKRIAVLIDNLNSKHFSDIVLAKLEKSAREISAYASTSIEGNPLPLTEVKKLLKNSPKQLRDSEQEIINYNQALGIANEYIQRHQAPDLAFILKIHQTIEHNLLPKFRLGKLRQEPVIVNNPKLNKQVYLPPDHQDVAALIQDLIAYVKINFKIIDPLILAGIFHKQFVIIHPFIDGNGRSARIVTKTILAMLGINTFKLFSFENYYNNNISKYFSKVGLLGNYYELKSAVDFTEWLEYFTDGIIDELLRITKEINSAATTPDKELKDYHLKIMAYIKEKGYITDKIYATISNRARPTRNLDFKKLIALGYIKPNGKGKSTYYSLAG